MKKKLWLYKSKCDDQGDPHENGVWYVEESLKLAIHSADNGDELYCAELTSLGRKHTTTELTLIKTKKKNSKQSGRN